MSDEIDYLGKFIVTNLRDVAMELATGLCENRFQSPGHRAFQQELAGMAPEHKKLLIETVAYSIDGAINDFLAHLEKEMRRKKSRLALTVDQTPCTELSPSLNQELHGNDGWFARYSKFKPHNAK